MKDALKKVNKRTSVGVAAFLISASYLASRLLGLLRDRLLAAHFGAHAGVLDAYAAAFRLPDLLFTLLVSGAFAVAFIPVLAEHLHKDDQEAAWELSSTLLNLMMVGTFVIGILTYIFADPLVSVFASGFDADRHRLTVELTRIMIFTPFFFAVSSVLGSIQQAFNRFFFYATASVFYNLGIIVGIVVLSDHYGVHGVAIGVVLGAGLQAMVQMLGLIGLGFRWRPSFNIRKRNVRKVLKLIIPRSLDQGLDQFEYLIQTAIGSSLAPGSLAAYYFANNLKNVPLSLFGSAIATAAFPRLAARAAADAKEKFVEAIVTNARLILFLVIPSAVVSVLLRGYIVRLLFGFGDATTADLLGWFSGAIVFYSLFFLIGRVFYAMQDTKTPLFTSLAAVGLNIILTVVLSRRYGVIGFPMAQSITSALEVFLLVGILKHRLGTVGGKSIMRGVAKMIVAAGIMTGTLYLLVSRVFVLQAADRGVAVIGPKFALLLVVSGLAYLVPCYILKLREAKLFITKLKHRIAPPLSLD